MLCPVFNDLYFPIFLDIIRRINPYPKSMRVINNKSFHMNFESEELVEWLQRYAIPRIFGPKFQCILKQSDHDVVQLEAKSFHVNLELQESEEWWQRYAIRIIFEP